MCYNLLMQNDKVYSITEIKAVIAAHKELIEQKYGVKSLLLFGSYAKNLQTPESDIDLLVTFSKPVDMFDFVDLQDYLSQIFKKKIDLGTINGLKEFVKNSILKETIAL